MVISSRTVGDIIVIDLDGNYSRDSRPSPDLGEQVKAALATGVKKFLIRLENVEFDGDWGIGQMLACYISIRNVNGILKLSGGSPSTLSFLRITMLDKVLDIYPSVEAALESFATS